MTQAPCSSSNPLSGFELRVPSCSLSKTRPVGLHSLWRLRRGQPGGRPTGAVAGGRPDIEARAFHARLVALYRYVGNLVASWAFSKLWSAGPSLASDALVIRKLAICAYVPLRQEANSTESTYGAALPLAKPGSAWEPPGSLLLHYKKNLELAVKLIKCLCH